MATVLYSSAEVRKAIINLFHSSKGQRVAIAAFVGRGAETYLPKPSGLQLYCWPKAGGTNPNVLRKLMKVGVKVFFVDSLHMKWYWTEDKGAVLTSANLSTNALGAGDLKEIGVRMKSDSVDIEHVIASLNARKVNQKELSQLDRLHRLYVAKNGLREEHKPTSFQEWFSLPLRSEWKLIWVETQAKCNSLRATEAARLEYNLKEPHCSLFVARKKDYRIGDWILYFSLGKTSASQPDWLFADAIFSVPTTDKKAYDAE